MVGVPEEFKKFEPLLTHEGREGLRSSLRQYRETYGAEWLEKFKERNPDVVMIIDLCANHTAAEALDGFKDYVAGWIRDQSGDSMFTAMALQVGADAFIASSRHDLELIHGLILAEIERPRF